MRINQARGLDIVMGRAALTAAGAETVYDSAAFTFAVNGKAYAKGGVVDGATPVNDINTGAAHLPIPQWFACCFMWLVNAAGTVAVAQGPLVAVDASGEYRDKLPEYPPIPDGYTPFAYHVVQNANATPFQFGASNWNATDKTQAIVNVTVLPDRPPNEARA